MRLSISLPIVLLISGMYSFQPKYSQTEKDGIVYVSIQSGPTLGYSAHSGVGIIENDRYAFKDLNKNGQLDAYEDWRLSTDERAKDLIQQMSIEQIAGLMIYSGHQAIPVLVEGKYVQWIAKVKN